MGGKPKYQIAKTLVKPERREVYLLKGTDGSEVVLKVFFGSNPWMKKRFLREQIALDVLQGLAVPKRIKISRSEVAKLVKQKTFSFTAVERISYPDCYRRALSTAEALGLWAFTLEQLCAFRRRQVLYTEMKDDHVMLAADHSAAVIIDFNDCVMVEPSGQYPFEFLGVTPALAAPEFYFSKTLAESVVVYQAGMLLGSLINGYFRNVQLGAKEFDHIKRDLFRHKAQDIFDLFKKCVAKNPLERPQSFETLFSKLARCQLPAQSLKMWAELRNPYGQALTDLGFKEPVTSKISKLNSGKKAS